MNDTELLRRIRERSRPLDPLPTEMEARLPELKDIRAVLFDIYGTLFVSAAGDIGVGLAIDGDRAFRAAMEAVGLPPKGGAALLTEAIEAEHARKRALGIEYPEVDIVEIWKTVLERLAFSVSSATLCLLALEYELRVNPVWPMPGLAALLAGLRQKGLLLGVISNAQFFTPLLFPAFLDRSLDELGFSSDCCIFSWRVGEAKPSRRLFELAAARLRARGIGPQQVLYLGNDCLNDLWPAGQTGFRTGLFAGDARSLRLRETDPRCREVEPDCVFRKLREVTQVID